MAEMAPPRLHELPSPVKPDHEKERRLKIRSQCREAAVQREQGFHHTSFIPAIEAGTIRSVRLRTMRRCIRGSITLEPLLPEWLQISLRGTKSAWLDQALCL